MNAYGRENGRVHAHEVEHTQNRVNDRHDVKEKERAFVSVARVHARDRVRVRVRVRVHRLHHAYDTHCAFDGVSAHFRQTHAVNVLLEVSAC